MFLKRRGEINTRQMKEPAWSLYLGICARYQHIVKYHYILERGKGTNV
jgi:hypothetical protein